MESLPESVGAFALLGIIRARGAEQEMKCKQEEFVPFNFSRFAAQEQASTQPITADSSPAVAAKRISHALPIV